MPHLLISGIPDLVADVASALKEHGRTAVEVGDIELLGMISAEM